MLELAKHKSRTAARTRPPEKFRWGIVDAILGLVMLPFGLWMFVIETIVHAATYIFDFDSQRTKN